MLNHLITISVVRQKLERLGNNLREGNGIPDKLEGFLTNMVL
jgi:hypothetical protein